MSLKIDQVDIAILPEIVQLNTKIFAGMYENPPYNLQQYQDKVNNISPLILVAKDKNILIGDSIAFKRDNNWYIWILGVNQSFRKKGIATKLLNLNEIYAKSQGLVKVTIKVLNVSPEMQRLLIAKNYLVTNIELSKSHPKYNTIHYSLDLS